MVLFKEYDQIPVNENEIRRYAHMAMKKGSASGEKQEETDNEAVENVLKSCIGKALKECTYRVCYQVFPVVKGEKLDLSFAKVTSKDLAGNLKDCDRVVLFAATVGPGMDRLVARAGKLSPSEAMLYQAIGAERVESLCDRFCEDLKTQFGAMVPRFSPGYGDLPLSLQKDVFQALDCTRKIGLTLNESLLMSPMKSVTALVGIRSQQAEISL